MIEKIGLKKAAFGLLLAIAILSAAPSSAVFAQDATITNARVVELTKMGLDEEIIIAKIKAGPCSFQLEDQDLIELKKSGVSPKVIAAMLEGSTLAAARVTIDKKPVVMHTLGQEKTGGRIGNYFTYGLKSVKVKAFLTGKHSSVIVSPSPVIEIELPKNDTIDNYILVHLDAKGDRRELEVASAGAIVGQKQGIRAEDIKKTSSQPLGGNKFKLNVQESLKPGEYFVYVVGTQDKVKGVYAQGYDFTVE